MIGDRAHRHETLLAYHNRPALAALATLARPCGRTLNLPGIGYIIQEPNLARHILNHDAFSSTAYGSMGTLITPVAGTKALVNMDGPDHRALKTTLMPLFNRRAFAEILPALLDKLLAPMSAALEAGEPVDFVPIVHQISNRLTCTLLGLPGPQTDAACERMSTLATNISRFFASEKPVPAPKALSQAALYCDELLALAGADAANNSQFATQIEHMGLSRDEKRGLLAVILVAGTETVAAALPRIVALLLDSGQWAAVQNEPALLKNTVDEGLRLVAASPAILRGITNTVTLDGAHFQPNRRAIILLSTLMAVPQDFAITRPVAPDLKRLWFGDGPHFCLGYALAEAEIAGTLEYLLRIGGRLTIRERRYPHHTAFPGYTRLVLQVTQP